MSLWVSCRRCGKQIQADKAYPDYLCEECKKNIKPVTYKGQIIGEIVNDEFVIWASISEIEKLLKEVKK